MHLPMKFTAAMALLSSVAAQAFPIAVAGSEGFVVISSGADPVIATYQGNSASYSNDLYVWNGTLNSWSFIFNNHSSPVGSTADLGSFAVGTELQFKLHVNNTGYDYFTGPAVRNPDGHAHARVQSGWTSPDTTLVSFEDLFNGPFEYNDLSFSFTNTGSSPEVPPPVNSVPEPETYALMLAGLALVASIASRRKR